MNELAVVLFFHKIDVSETEWLACASIFKKLSQRKIFIIVPSSQANHIEAMLIYRGFQGFKMIPLNDKNFLSIRTYNFLLSSAEFYKLFSEFHFILIAQLDVMIKQDVLSYWMSKNFSFIGAPWVPEDTEQDRLIVGNGGLSLRKVQHFIDILTNDFKICYPVWYLQKKKTPRILWSMINKLVSLRVFRNHIRKRVHEDFYFTQMIVHDTRPFDIAPGDVAINFALEKMIDRVDHTSEFLLGYHAFDKYLDPQHWEAYEN